MDLKEITQKLKNIEGGFVMKTKNNIIEILKEIQNNFEIDNEKFRKVIEEERNLLLDDSKTPKGENKVYIVFGSDYNSWRMKNVYSDKKKAEKEVEILNKLFAWWQIEDLEKEIKGWDSYDIMAVYAECQNNILDFDIKYNDGIFLWKIIEKELK